MKLNILKSPPAQRDIISNWNSISSPLVSICMLSYNHERYIKDALNSILNQKTDFGFEILIHDDASTDSTQNIISDYTSRYPEIIKPILQKENQYSQGIHPSVHFNYPRAKAPFIAICEGDDHWTDNKKLQNQVDILRDNLSIGFCFHQAYRQDFMDSSTPDKIIGDYGSENSIISHNDIVFRTQGWIPYASCLFRQEVKEVFFEFIKERSYLTLGDLYFQFFGSMYNGAAYIAKPMSLYRLGTESSWTRAVSLNIKKKARHEIAMILSYYEIYYENKYKDRDRISALILLRLLWLFKPKKFEEKPSAALTTISTLPEACIKELDLYLAYNHYSSVVNVINETLKGWKSKKAKYIIYGRASGCSIILNFIGSSNVLAIVDRDNKSLNEFIDGVPVIHTDEIINYSNFELLISTVSSNKKFVFEYAERNNIPINKVHYLFGSAIKWLSNNQMSLEYLREINHHSNG